MHYVISGGSGGLGKEVALHFASKNSVTIVYNHHKPDLPNSVHCIQNDLSVPGIIDFDYIIDNRIVFIHLAGVSLNAAFKGKTKEQNFFSFDNFEKQFRVNVLGGLKVVYSLWPKMKNNKFGRIVFISSVVAHLPVFGTLGYSMSKGAMENTVKTLMVEGAKDYIYPYCIASGYTDCGMIKQVSLSDQAALKERIPLRRFGTVDELINAIDFLVDTPYMAGQTIHLNGGIYI